MCLILSDYVYNVSDRVIPVVMSVIVWYDQ